MSRQRDYQPTIDRHRAKVDGLQRQLASVKAEHARARREADWAKAEIARLELRVDALNLAADVEASIARGLRRDLVDVERALDTCSELLQAETAARQAAERRLAERSQSFVGRLSAAVLARGRELGLGAGGRAA